MRTTGSHLWASSEDDRVKFPAFVRLPASALPHSRRSLCSNDQDFVKCVSIEAVYSPSSAHGGRNNFRRILSQRWRILEDQIRAVTVNLEGTRVLIETDEDWQDWLSSFFYRSTHTSNSYGSDRPSSCKEFAIEPIFINIIVDEESLPDGTPAGANVRASNAPPIYTEVADRSAPTTQEPITQSSAPNEEAGSHQQTSRGFPLAGSIHPQQQQQQQQQQQPPGSQLYTESSSQQGTRQGETQTEPMNASTQAQAIFSEGASASALASNIATSVLQALGPQLLPGLPSALATALSTLSAAQLLGAALINSSSRSNVSISAASVPLETPVPSTNAARSAPAPASESATHEIGSTTQRQSLIAGMFDELSRVRAQQPPTIPQQAADFPATEEEDEGAMTNELGQAFAEMLARQRASTTSNATTDPTSTATTVQTTTTTEAVEHGEEDDSLTIVSTPSTTARTSPSLSRSRSRSPRRTTFLSNTTLTLLTIFSFLFAFISPTLASPTSPSSSSLLASLNPSPLYPRDGPVAPRQNSRHLHLCKCTCFQTNSTLVPLYSPVDPSKPCGTCTRQFCLDQGLEMCKGAKLEHTDHDVGTGFEGDVWAKCFERDSYKDQSIITLYLLVVVGLVGFAAMRGRVEGWVQRYQQIGPQGLYSAVRDAPWRRSR